MVVLSCALLIMFVRVCSRLFIIVIMCLFVYMIGTRGSCVLGMVFVCISVFVFVIVCYSVLVCVMWCPCAVLFALVWLGLSGVVRGCGLVLPGVFSCYC